jgi:hypothetical protein
MAKKYPMERLKPRPSNTNPEARRLPNGGHMSTTEYNMYQVADAANGVTAIRDDADDTKVPGNQSTPKQPMRSDEYRQAEQDTTTDRPNPSLNTNPHDNLQPRYLSIISSKDRFTGESL